MGVASGWILKPRLSFPKELYLSPGPTPTLPTPISFKDIDYFLNEEVKYDINFLWFKKAAEGSFKFTREGKGYRAVLEAETKGFIGFFTSYRKHRYVSYMTYLPEKRKLQVNRFERYAIIRKREEKTITDLDYDTRLMNWEEYKKGRLIEEKSEPIPEGAEYEDILSAFYNFRMGVFGPIEKNRKFEVNTIPEKGVSTISVKICGEEDAPLARKLFGSFFSDDLVHVKVKVPKDIFKSKKGEVSMLLNDKIIPLQGVVKDYIGFGDIKGTLKNG